MGDSNTAGFPPLTVHVLQIDSYPGGTFRHAEAMITKATSSTTMEKVILSFGLYKMSNKLPSNSCRLLTEQQNSDFQRWRSG